MIDRQPAEDAEEAPERPRAVALVQFAVEDGAPARNLARAEALMQTASAADLYVFPELFTTGYAHATWPLDADEHTPLALAAMRRWAANRRAWVAGSLLTRREDGALVNRMVVFGPQRADETQGPVRTYDKSHLFPPMHEPEHLAAGDARARTRISGTVAALSICFDLRFPEMYRLDAVAGAELFVVSSAWPQARGEAQRLFARARAAENQATLVLCNRTGTGADGVVYAGGSCVIGPDGAVLVDAGTRDGVVLAEVDLGAAARLRARFPVLPLRRPGVDTEDATGTLGRLDPDVEALALEAMRARREARGETAGDPPILAGEPPRHPRPPLS